jgi:hypothetical protein
LVELTAQILFDAHPRRHVERLEESPDVWSVDRSIYLGVQRPVAEELKFWELGYSALLLVLQVFAYFCHEIKDLRLALQG